MTFFKYASFIILTILVFVLPSKALLANEKTNNKQLTVSDGPYINIDPAQPNLEINWLCRNQVNQTIINIQTAPLPYYFKACDLNAAVDRVSFKADAMEYEGKFNVVALSDLHGQYDLMLTLLKNNSVIDQQGNWAFDDGHFVITGDIFDRGDKVTEILWFIYKLEQQAEQAGGKVHLLLGNHEVMVLNGDLRYLHPKYIQTAALFNQPFDALFSKISILGRWLRSKSVLVKVNNMLFAHGGFHPSLAHEKRTLEEINRVFKSNLIKNELTEPRAGWGRYLHKSNGPIWYRGYFKDDGASSAEIDLLLKHFNVAHLVVGHTSQKQVEARFQGRVIAIDSSIKNGQYGEVLHIEGNKLSRGTLSGKRLPLYEDK
ncbi:metallophosphoesterase [Thalassotalea piscium]|uniref:Calcineurin-like phosphoesterase domain-containing protein n=1 Tax=Thalassotalea piscium TaxID=1230533 RepID=A0A7X0TTC3_9GAMM|nr:metallophosphoesterase [Thalassotalea piscium]MBB6542940.1 hypothetical protein [Thalassotalea piscium]